MSQLASVTISGTGCRKHRHVSLLASVTLSWTWCRKHRHMSQLASVTISGTGCRKHSHVSQLAQRLPAASLILFLGRCEHATLMSDVTDAVRQHGRAETVVVVVCSHSRSSLPHETKVKETKQNKQINKQTNKQTKLNTKSESILKTNHTVFTSIFSTRSAKHVLRGLAPLTHWTV